MGHRLLTSTPDEKYEEILSPNYRRIWLRMDNGGFLTMNDKIILACLEFKPPPDIQPDESPNANDMIAYIHQVNDAMGKIKGTQHQQGTDLSSKFQAATGAMHSSVPLLATTSTGTRPVSTTDTDSKQPDEEKKEEVALPDAPAADGYAEEKSNAEPQDTKAPVNMYTTNPAFRYF